MARAPAPEDRARIGPAGRAARACAAALACAAAIAALLAPPAGAAAPPPGFVVEPVVSGLDVPVAIDFAADGTMFVAEKRGVVRVFRDGELLPTPFIDISEDVNDRFEHGMLGLAVHPSFPSVPYVYVLYTHDPPGLPKDDAGARVARVERIEADPANPVLASSSPSARTVLLGRQGDASAIPDPSPPPFGVPGRVSCRRAGARVPDCIPQDSYRHQIGTVAFGADGALYVGNGDVDRLPNGPLDPANLIGAVMRIDPLTGAGLPDNPFFTGDPTSNLSKTWAFGLRNPFRFSIDPASGQVLIGDVGAQNWEVLHEGAPGKDYRLAVLRGRQPRLRPVPEHVGLPVRVRRRPAAADLRVRAHRGGRLGGRGRLVPRHDVPRAVPGSALLRRLQPGLDQDDSPRRERRLHDRRLRRQRHHLGSRRPEGRAERGHPLGLDQRRHRLPAPLHRPAAAGSARARHPPLLRGPGHDRVRRHPATATTPSCGTARPGAPGGSAAASRSTGTTTSRRSPTRRASRSATS